MSTSADATIIAVQEVTYNTAPTSAYETLRFTGESLNAGTTATDSQEVSGTNRMISDSLPTGLEVGGGIDIEFSEDTFDLFLPGAMASAWDVSNGSYDELTLSNDLYSYTIEKQFNDISKIIQFRGMRVNTFSLNAEYGSPVTGSFNFAGGGADATLTATVAGSVTAATTTDVMNACADFATLKIGGVASTAIVQSIDLEISQNLSPVTGLGTCGPQNQRLGSKAAVTGSMTASLDATTYAWYIASLSNVDMSMEFTLLGATEDYTFIIPVMKNNGDAPTIGDDDIQIQLNFTAIRTPISVRKSK